MKSFLQRKKLTPVGRTIEKAIEELRIQMADGRRPNHSAYQEQAIERILADKLGATDKRDWSGAVLGALSVGQLEKLVRNAKREIAKRHGQKKPLRRGALIGWGGLDELRAMHECLTAQHGVRSGTADVLIAALLEVSPRQAQRLLTTKAPKK